MSDETDNLVLARLREIRVMLGEVKEDTADTRLRTGMLEGGYASISLPGPAGRRCRASVGSISWTHRVNRRAARFGGWSEFLNVARHSVEVAAT
jgi:hypothetical protein